MSDRAKKLRDAEDEIEKLTNKLAVAHAEIESLNHKLEHAHEIPAGEPQPEERKRFSLI